jgi:hypothetical protein
VSRRCGLPRFLAPVLILGVILLVSSAGFAQNCALCYTQAASSGSRIIQALRSGILVLVIPPMFMSIGITVLAYRKRNQFNRRHTDTDEHDRGGW